MKKIKRYVAIIMSIAAVFTSVPQTCLADAPDSEEDSKYTIGEVGGYLRGNSAAIKTMAQDRKFSAYQGHGFAAENANNLADVFQGKNATVVGNDNLLNGPDRKVINRNGDITWIQDKYYDSASRSIGACFDENGFRYFDSEHRPMQIEVPSDQYEDAVKFMEKRISDGQIEGITNPDEARNIVKKGNVTYKQSVNIAKAGNVDSLVYDAANGVVVSTGAVAIGFVLDYAYNIINGESVADSLKSAVVSGFKTGGVVFATYVVSSQLAKTSISIAFNPTFEAVVKHFGSDFAESVLTTGGTDTATLTAAQMTTKAATALKNQAIFTVVTVAVLESGDVVEIFRGRISKEQFISNLAVTASSVVTGIGGYYVGAAIGSLIIPGPGTAIGSFAGGMILGYAGDYLARLAANAIYEGDGNKMYAIIEDTYTELANDYIVTEGEAKEIADSLNKKLSDKTLKDMYSSKDRKEFAKNLMEPLFESQVAKREKITPPSEEEIRSELVSDLDEIVFIH